ncbi:putative ribonuclease H-like domain-containing protein, partial [Tanacetum coccineum]
MAGSQDDIPPPPPSPSQTPTQQTPHTVSTIKLPILKKGEYDIWAMKMEHYLAHTDYPIWEVIQNGNGPVSITTDTQGQIKVLPPRTAEEILARERERKARTTLLMALPEDHLAKFHKMTDAKEIWDAIKSRVGGNDESKKKQKYILKHQFEGFSVSNLEGLHKGYDRFQSLLSQLEIHEAGALLHHPLARKIWHLSLRTQAVLEMAGVDEFDLEEMDLKWQVAMISMRMRKFYKKTGRKLQFDAKEPVGFDKTKVECYNYHKTGGVAQTERFVKIDLDDKTDVLTYHKKLLAEAEKEKEDLKAKVEKWHNSSKNHSLLKNSQMSANDKFELGYGDHRYDGILSYENEVLQSVFMNKESDLENQPLYNRFVTAEGMHTYEPVGFDKTKVECYNCNKTGHFARECRTKGNQDSRRRDAWNFGNKNKENGRRSGKQEDSKALVTIDGEGVDWTSHSEEEEDYALMACNSSGSDTELEGQLVAHQQGQLSKEEKIRFMKIDLDDKTDVLTYHKKLLAEAENRRKRYGRANDKFGLGYGDHRYDGILSYENEVLQSVFMNKESDLENQPLYDRFVTAEGMHVVPPPMTGNYMPSGPDIEIDYSQFTYGPKQSQTSESETQTSDFDTCESDCSVETHEPLPEPTVNEPKVVSQPKVWSDAPIIEEYESDSEDEHVSLPTEEQETPSFANQQVKTPRETVKNQFTHSKNPKVDKKGLGYGFTTKACFVCGSLSHLIRDCDFHEKRMAKQAELNNRMRKKSSQREIRPIWNNVQRVNHKNQFVPTAVLTRTGKIPVSTARASGTNNVSTARHNFNRQAVPPNAAMKVNTVKPIVNNARPKGDFHKSVSPFRRPFNKTTTLRTKFSKQKVNTAEVNAVSAVGGKRETAVKPSAGKLLLSPQQVVIGDPKDITGTKSPNTMVDQILENDNPQRALKNKGIVDSGCSRHMTGNKAYLAEYQDYNGGPVAFGGSKGYITGKGKIKIGKLDFEDVCFVKELQHFNLFSVSQMCDKKNKVLFTDTECLVLSSDFKLPDENQVLLRIPRQNNMYSFNIENIVPSRGLACLIAKATVDESNKWHRRLGHVNFKNLNKLVKGNLVREFKNRDIIEFYGSKGIKREYSNARTPQQNRVAERKNRTLIEAARTMLPDSFLPNTFWAEAVSTACYVLNRVLVTKPQNKTPYELLTADPAQDYFVLPICSSYTSTVKSSEAKNKGEKPNKDTGLKTNEEPVDQEDQAFLEELERLKRQEKEANDAAKALRKEFAQETKDLLLQAGAARATSTNTVNTVRTPVSTASSFGGPSYPDLTNYADQDDSQIPALENIYDNPNDGIFTNASYDDEGAVADFTNLETTVNRRNNHKSFQHCLFACFLSQIEPKKISEAIEDESWVDVMQEELLQFKIQKVWILVDFPYRNKVIRTKWVYKNKKDERGVMVRNKMDVKSAFLYGTIDEEVYVSQPPGFVDLMFPKKSGYRRGTIDKTLFIKKDKNDIMLVQVKQKEDGIFISQDKYVVEILKKFDFMSVKIACTPIETHKPLVKDEEAADVDVHLYRFQVTPKTLHLHAVKRIFRYLKGKPKLGLWYPKESSFDLVAYSDSDYRGANLDRKSTTGGCKFLGHRLISWQCKKQTIVATSTTEAEYVVAANYYGQHIEIRHNFIRDAHEKKLIQVLKIHTDDNMADLLDLKLFIHQELASPEQTASGKDFSNPLIVDIDQSHQIFLEELKKLKRHETEANDAAKILRRECAQDYEDLVLQEGIARASSTNNVNKASTSVNTASTPVNTASALGDIPDLEDIYEVPKDGLFTNASYDDEGVVTDFNNLETFMDVSPMAKSRIHTIHPTSQILGDPKSVIEPKKISEALAEAIGTKWVYRNKKDKRGVIIRYKARLVAQVYQMDVKSAFLYGTINEEVYVSQPPGFVDPKYPNKVYKVVKALYGLHQAPKAWYATLSAFLEQSGYRRGTIDNTLFIKKEKKDIMLVQVYVDDIIFGSTKKSWCDEFEALIKSKFQMSSMGELAFFLGLQVKQKADGIFISQDKYVAEILKKFDFMSVKHASTPIETHKPLVKDKEAADVDVHLYRSMIGSLMYLTTSRPDIMYLKGKPKLVLWYPRDSSFDLVAYSDSDYGGANLDRKSTTGGCQFLGHRLISWQCKKQTIVATSTTEAEYVAAANCCGQVLWIQYQMLDYGFNFMNTRIYIDNESTICIVKNPVFHSKTKHIEIRHHFIKDAYEKKMIQVLKIHTNNNVADLLTKAFDVSRHQELASPEQTASGLTATGKESSNPLMADSLPKTIQSNDPPLSRGYTLGSGEDSLKLMELMAYCTNLCEFVSKKNREIKKVKVLVSEASIRRHLKLEDSEGLSSLPNAEIFEQLANMG